MGRIDRRPAKSYVEALWDDEQRLVEAAAKDGWPKAMVRTGLGMHRESWDVDSIATSLQAELRALEASKGHRVVWPKRVHHIWPALPGAGLTPLLVGMLLGLEQVVHCSRRGLFFSRQLAHHAPWELLEDDDSWKEADLVVVSGSDETLDSVRREVEPQGRVVGYGHRVSMAVVVDGSKEGLDLQQEAQAIASDVVMWHQKGCFSVRAVLFCGREERCREFAEVLAQAIADGERRWDARGVGDAELANRAQALGVAEMGGEVFVEGVGYVRIVDEPFDGSREAIHSVTVHSVEGPERVREALSLATGHVQGVSLSVADEEQRGPWIEALSRAGATRICKAGRLQTPPAVWWHDGRPNALSWGRVVTIG